MRLREFSLEQIQVGYQFSPLTYQISEDLIFQYAHAVDDLCFLYRDSKKALSGPFQGNIAPPTLASLFVLKTYRTDWIPPPGGIQLKQKFRFYGPMRPGDVLSVQAELTQKVKKKGNWHLTFTSHAKDQKREIVVWSESTSVWQEKDVKVDKIQNSRKQNIHNQNVEIIAGPTSTAQRKGWKIGDLLPIVIKKITREKILQYEEILGIGNPIHFDEKYAKTTSFKGIIAHGLVNAAYISESMMKVFPWEWVHHGEMEIQFLRPLSPGDTCRTQGKLERKESTGKGMLLVFDVGCKNQHGETVVTGTTTVQMANNK